MSILRSDVLQAGRDLINSEDTTILSASRLYRAFTRLCREWARETRSLSSETAIDLVASQQEYDLRGLVPRAFRIRSVNWRATASSAPRELEFVPFGELPAAYQVYPGTPVRWYSRGTAILGLYPKPSASIAGGLTVDTQNLPVDLAEDATPDGTFAVSAATNATPVVLTTAAHSLKTGQRVVVASVGGNAAANGAWTVTIPDTTHVSLNGSIGSGAYTSGGTAQTVLQFPDHHLEGLAAGMAAMMCRLAAEDPAMGGRFPDMQSEYLRLRDAIAAEEGNPGRQLLRYGAGAGSRAGAQWPAGALPSGWGVRE